LLRFGSNQNEEAKTILEMPYIWENSFEFKENTPLICGGL
jgi:hypothetical protein